LKDVAVVMGLDEFVPVGGRAPCRQKWRRLEWFAEMREDFPDRPRLRDERDQPDVAAAVWALQRKLLPHPRHEFRPGDSGGVVRAGFLRRVTAAFRRATVVPMPAGSGLAPLATCPSCHQKRALLTSIHVAEEVCAAVAHRQVVLTIPKRLRLHTRFDRQLLGQLCTCAWTCIQAEVRRLLGRDDVVPGMVAAIQRGTRSRVAANSSTGTRTSTRWSGHPVHRVGGAFTPDGEFLELPELDLERLQAAWQEAVFALYLAEEKIEPEVVENMRTWPHSGFSVDQSVFLAAGDRAGIERLVGYMTRCPFSLSRLVQVTATGQVVYKAEKNACRALPDPQDEGLASGPTRNFQILDPLHFLAEFTQHIPPKGAHLIRYYGWYSNKSRGLRRKQAEAAAAEQPGSSARPAAEPAPARSRPSQTWAMLIKRVFEIDPLICPRCSGQMKIVAFLEPPQGDVTCLPAGRSRRSCGIAACGARAAPRAPPGGDLRVYDPDSDWDSDSTSREPRELTFVDEATFWSTF